MTGLKQALAAATSEQNSLKQRAQAAQSEIDALKAQSATDARAAADAGAEAAKSETELRAEVASLRAALKTLEMRGIDVAGLLDTSPTP